MAPTEPTSPRRALALVGLAIATRQRASLRTLRDLELRHGPVDDWWSVPGRRASAAAGDERLAGLAEGGLDAEAARALAALERAGFSVVETGAWPRLLELPDPPAVLFQRGEARPAVRTLAVVGARRATAYGLRVTDLLVDGLARRDVAVASGLARGIDARAHRSALAAGGFTLAVLGCGPDSAYPPEHRDLQDRIGREGVVISEYLPGTRPLPPHFPRRNRILVALSDAVLVIEARRRSGTLTSVGWAADLGREVLVVPGPVDSELAEGPLDLLREGATAVGSVAHVLEALGLPPADAPALATRGPALGEAEERVVALLEGGALDLDEIVRTSGEAPSRVLTIVLSLEARGVIARLADGRSFRRNQAGGGLTTGATCAP
jgi:DNA processing protein